MDDPPVFPCSTPFSSLALEEERGLFGDPTLYLNVSESLPRTVGRGEMGKDFI